jgi:hypothetical protein
MGNVHPYFSWRGKDSTPPTNAEMVASSIALAEEAAHLEREARQRWSSSMGGSKACSEAAADLARAQSDQRHWRGYAEYYREQLAIEMDAVRARDVARAAAQARQAAREILEMPPVASAEPPYEREPGSDDGDDDEPQSAWADIGGAVGGAR